MEIVGLKPTRLTILQFTPDSRWTEGKLEIRSKDGSREEYTLPFLGWAVQVNHVDAEDQEYETEIVPVFLDEEAYPRTTRDMTHYVNEGDLVMCVGLVKS